MDRDLGNSSLKHQVYNVLKSDIITGRYKAGEQLNMVELCADMNISSSPIREAFNLLAKDGFIILKPRKKPIVADISDFDFNVIADLRLKLEPYAAILSIGKIPTQAFEEVRSLLNGVLRSPSDFNAYTQSDLAFHKLLHSYAGSKLLSDILVTIHEQSSRDRYITGTIQRDDISVQSTKEHLAILDALEAEDSARVEELIVQHIDCINYRHQYKQPADG